MLYFYIKTDADLCSLHRKRIRDFTGKPQKSGYEMQISCLQPSENIKKDPAESNQTTFGSLLEIRL